MMVVDNNFQFGQVVYLKTDKEQLPRMVVRLSVKPGEVLYCLAAGTVESWHLDFEISEQINVLMISTG